MYDVVERTGQAGGEYHVISDMREGQREMAYAGQPGGEYHVIGDSREEKVTYAVPT